MSFYLHNGYRNDGTLNGGNDDEQITNVKKGEAQDTFDQTFSQFGNAPPQSSIRLIGKHLRSRYPSTLTIANLQDVYFADPVGFIAILEEVSPFFKSTIATASMMGTNGEFKFEVRSTSGDEIIPEKCEELRVFFNSQPISVGDINTLVGSLLKEIMFYADGIAFQGIGFPDDDGMMGYAYLKPFSTNSTNLGRNSSDEQGLYQRRSDGVIVELNMEHTFWQANEPTLSSPNGTYDMTSGLLEGISEIITSRDLRDGVRGAGSPVRLMRYDRDSLIKTAVETMGITIRAGAKIAQFVADQIKTIESYAKSRRHAETMVVAKDVEVINVEPANFQNVVPAIETLQIRTAASFGNHANLMGFGEATKSGLQYQLVAQRIDYKRSKVLKLLERFCEAHFLLKGEVVVVTIVAPQIHLGDELVEQNALQMIFMNAVMQYGLGLISREELSRKITGRSPKGEEKDGVLDALLKISASPGGLDNNSSQKTETSGGKNGKPAGK